MVYKCANIYIYMISEVYVMGYMGCCMGLLICDRWSARYMYMRYIIYEVLVYWLVFQLLSVALCAERFSISSYDYIKGWLICRAVGTSHSGNFTQWEDQILSNFIKWDLVLPGGEIWVPIQPPLVGNHLTARPPVAARYRYRYSYIRPPVAGRYLMYSGELS